MLTLRRAVGLLAMLLVAVLVTPTLALTVLDVRPQSETEAVAFSDVPPPRLLQVAPMEDEPVYGAAGLATIDGNALQDAVVYVAAAREAEAARVAAEHEAERARQKKLRDEAARQAAPAPAVSSGACGGWENLIASFWPADQVARACRVMLCESNGSPTARNARSSAAGAWQFLSATHRSYGEYPKYATADQAPMSSQTAAAFRLWRARGWSPWVCR